VNNILIIGGNKGIGLAICQKLLVSNNNRIFCTSRNYPDELNTLDKLNKIQCDITSVGSIKNLKQQLSKYVTHIDRVINCAGVLHTNTYMPEKSLSQVNQEHLVDNFFVNAMGHILLLQHIENFLVAANNPIACSLSARIASISDNYLGGWYAYRMSKAALNMGYKTLEIEWKRKHPHIKILLIHPGTTDTDLSKPFQKRMNLKTLQSSSQTAAMIDTQINNKLNGELESFFIDFNGNNIEW